MLPKAMMCALLIAVAGMSTHFDAAEACTCVGVSLEGAISDAGAIFTATVLDTQRTEFLGVTYWMMTVQVHQYWKGVISDPMVIYTGENEAVCGLLVYPGEEYLFFAYGNPGEYGIGLCSYTMPIRYAGDVIAQLGPPLAVQAGSDTWGKVKSIYR
jgi:hypothetical protein